MSGQNISYILIAAAIVFLALAIVTLLPFPSPTLSDLGYHALCPFAPWSTLLLLFLGGISWAFHRYVKGQAG
jgi:hypothetical protein